MSGDAGVAAIQMDDGERAAMSDAFAVRARPKQERRAGSLYLFSLIRP